MSPAATDPATSAGSGAASVTIVYGGGPQQFSVSPTTKVYGSLTVGQTAAQTFTVTNTGASDMAIETVALTGAGAAAFSIDSDTCASATVPVAGTCEVTASFAPTAGGARSASLDFAHDGGTTDSVALSGTGSLPAGPAPSNLTSSGTGTAAQTATATIPSGGRVRLLGSGAETASVTVTGEGIFTVDIASGVITFTPALGFHGTASPVTFRAVDAYGQTGDASYTPTVNLPAAPTAPAPATSGDQGASQRARVPVPAGGRVLLVDDNGVERTSISIASVGRYTVDSSGGELTFQPEPAFTRAAPRARFRVLDAYGRSVDGHWSAQVIPVPAATDPVTGTGTPAPVVACVSRRTLTISWWVKRGSTLRGQSLVATGMPKRSLRPAQRSATVDLRGRPKQTVRVVVSAVTRDGKRLESVRTYRTCAKATGARTTPKRQLVAVER